MSLDTTSPSLKPRLESGLFLVIVVVPLVFTPFTTALFVDPKLVVLLAGAALIALSKPVVDRTLALVTSLFLLAVLLATLLGEDPLWSTLGSEWRGVGLLTFAACAVLLCTATALDQETRAKIPEWLFWTGVVVAAIGIVRRFVTFGVPAFGPLGSTIGHRVFVGGFIAAAIIAATAMRRSPFMYVGLVVLASDLAISAARSGWIAVVVGLMIVLWRRRNWRAAGGLLLPIAAVLTAWTVASPYLPAGLSPYSAAPRFLQLGEGNGLERVTAWKAYAHAFASRPLLGSGPQTTWHAFLSNASASQLRIATRDFGDPHNIFLELATTTGILGLLAAGALTVVVLKRALRAPPERAWALGAVGALVVVQMLEPTNLVLTPLMFLAAGLAVADPSAAHRLTLRAWAAIPLLLGLVLASTDLVASGFETFGRTRTSEAAYHIAHQIAPWRLWAPMQLAVMRADDFQRGEDLAGADARRLVRTTVDRHGWYPLIRLTAVDVELAVGDPAAAERLVDEDLRIFPNDPVALARKADLLLRRGDRRGAYSFARRALDIDPTLDFALRIERDSRG